MWCGGKLGYGLGAGGTRPSSQGWHHVVRPPESGNLFSVRSQNWVRWLCLGTRRPSHKRSIQTLPHGVRFTDPQRQVAGVTSSCHVTDTFFTFQKSLASLFSERLYVAWGREYDVCLDFCFLHCLTQPLTDSRCLRNSPCETDKGINGH